MKKEKSIILTLLVIIIILIGININFIVQKNSIVKNNKQIIKEMNESTQVTDLNNQINSLNTKHSEYANYVQACKTKLATALTTEGVTTSNEDTLETMAENISKVLEARTKDATATAEDIANGKIAYVKGERIVGKYDSNSILSMDKLMYVATSYSEDNYNGYPQNGIDVQNPWGNNSSYGLRLRNFEVGKKYCLITYLSGTLSENQPTITGGEIIECNIGTHEVLIIFTVDNTTSTVFKFSFTSGSIGSYGSPQLCFEI